LKVLKLSGAALLTLSLCFSYTFLFARSRLDGNYRCWRYAVSFVSCFGDKAFDFIADIDGIQYEGNTGNYIDASILYLGAFEKDILYFLRDTMTAAYSGRGVFVDIGANTGQHSLFMSRYATEVHAFEPWEPVLRRFRSMVASNHIKNIKSTPSASAIRTPNSRSSSPLQITWEPGRLCRSSYRRIPRKGTSRFK
jgi:hypothetical protein